MRSPESCADGIRQVQGKSEGMPRRIRSTISQDSSETGRRGEDDDAGSQPGSQSLSQVI